MICSSMPSPCEVKITTERMKKIKSSTYVQRSIIAFVRCDHCGIRESVSRKGFVDTPIFQAQQKVSDIVAERCLKLSDAQRANMPINWIPEIVFSSSLVKE